LWLLTPVTLSRELAIKVVVAIAMLHLCYVPARLGDLLALTGVFVFMSAVVAGITYALALSGTSVTGEPISRIGWYFLIGGPLILTLPVRGTWAVISRYFRSAHQSALLRFAVGSSLIEQEAILDTGNSLHEPLSFRPVVVVDFHSIRDYLPKSLADAVIGWQSVEDMSLDSIPDSIMERISLIPYNTVAGSGMMMGVRPDYCELWVGRSWHRVDVIIGFASGETNLAGKTALLPYTVWPVEMMGKGA